MTLLPGWASVSLGDIAQEVKNGISTKPDASTGVPILRISAVRPMSLNSDDVRCLEPSSEWASYRLAVGDLLFTRYNGNPSLVGVCARVRDVDLDGHPELVYPDKLIRVRLVPELAEPGFVERAAHSELARAFIQGKTKTSAGQVGVSGADLKALPIPLPPLNEQRRIVAKLDAIFEQTRAAKARLDRLPALLNKLKRSILTAAFRGDLTADWRAAHPEVEPASALFDSIRAQRRQSWDDANRAKNKGPVKVAYSEPLVVDAHDLPDLPSGWAWAALGFLSDIQSGVPKGQKRRPDDVLRLVPYLRVANVQRGHLDLDEVFEIAATQREIDDLALRPGDILLNEGGDRDKLGRGWVWDAQLPLCIHQNHVFRARLYDQRIDPRLVSTYGNAFGQPWFIDEGKQTTNLASISKSKLSRFPVPVPPAAEQVVLAERIFGLMTSIDQVSARIATAELRTIGLERAALAKAFRGELVEQDPLDEPAAVLLDRIRVAIAQPEPSSRRPGRREGGRQREPSAEP